MRRRYCIECIINKTSDGGGRIETKTLVPFRHAHVVLVTCARLIVTCKYTCVHTNIYIYIYTVCTITYIAHFCIIYAAGRGDDFRALITRDALQYVAAAFALTTMTTARRAISFTPGRRAETIKSLLRGPRARIVPCFSVFNFMFLLYCPSPTNACTQLRVQFYTNSPARGGGRRGRCIFLSRCLQPPRHMHSGVRRYVFTADRGHKPYVPKFSRSVSRWILSFLNSITNRLV